MNMNIENVNLQISRVEVYRKVYDSQSRIIEEQVEFYYPEEINSLIGFNMEKKCGGKKK